MKKLTLLLAALAFLVSSAQAGTIMNQPRGAKADATMPKGKFAKAIEDLPIMPGLELAGDNDMLFIFGDKRIAQTTLEGLVDVDDVYYFYEKSLPALGWQKVDMKNYERGGERLLLDASSTNDRGLAIVKFEVQPIQAR